MKKQLPHLLLAVDPGASGTKAIGSIVGQPDCQAVLMTPHCSEVDEGDLLPNPQFDEHSVWVKIAQESYAVGQLAEIKYNAINKLKPAKFGSAALKICGVIGVFAQKFNLPAKFHLSISFVLPPAEWEHRTIVIERLQAAMEELDTPRGRIKPKLASISPFPEGMGILLGQNVDIKDVPTMTVVMLGFRNASVFTSRNGTVNLPQASDLGFNDLLKQIAGKTGYHAGTMTEPVFKHQQSLNNVKNWAECIAQLELELKQGRRPFSPDRSENVTTLIRFQESAEKAKLAIGRSLTPLLRCTGKDRQIELDKLIETIATANRHYWGELGDWLEETMPSQSDKVCIAGGTANYFKVELQDFLKTKVVSSVKGAVCWHSAIELPDRFKVYNDRFDDIYSLWQQMERRFIPATAESKVATYK